MDDVSIGFRAKTARAIAVALACGNSAPTFLARWEISLCDPRNPATRQPYHGVLDLPWIDAQVAAGAIERRIENIAIEALSALLSEVVSRGCRVGSVGVVGSPDRNLARIGNSHIRAHAAEGILFRRVLEVAAAKHKLRWRHFSDRGFEETANLELRRAPHEVKTALAAIGHSAGRPWRADERAAATAAWLMLQPA